MVLKKAQRTARPRVVKTVPSLAHLTALMKVAKTVQSSAYLKALTLDEKKELKSVSSKTTVTAETVQKMAHLRASR